MQETESASRALPVADPMNPNENEVAGWGFGARLVSVAVIVRPSLVILRVVREPGVGVPDMVRPFTSAATTWAAP
ncbi:hypothetical protein F4560_003327 [Saccharothrix ecbatanensis]|uniref:Uncharacterized protein n=1 Tax=Saccharothrix ecbatanensis TaxID=1105145 RepID=A0A7W9HKM8_9PSEU|nr:hypothetical protein [Saccharothrix ecbatanensis]